ncbi:hypothetical protein KM043_011538 [Ampulex compressa]|nr:hypothetical protein KM043_011538 [Ampulex compressa]
MAKQQFTVPLQYKSSYTTTMDIVLEEVGGGGQLFKTEVVTLRFGPSLPPEESPDRAKSMLGGGSRGMMVAGWLEGGAEGWKIGRDAGLRRCRAGSGIGRAILDPCKTIGPRTNSQDTRSARGLSQAASNVYPPPPPRRYAGYSGFWSTCWRISAPGEGRGPEKAPSPRHATKRLAERATHDTHNSSVKSNRSCFRQRDFRLCLEVACTEMSKIQQCQ